MNTYVWGPPTWRLLHSFSALPPEQLRQPPTHDALLDFLATLGLVMPCKYCRQTYVEFTRDQLPPAEDALRTGSLSLWVYSLHALVNKKLEVPTPTLARIQTRQAVQPCGWSPRDVCDMIAVFGLNYKPSNHDAYAVWWATLAPLMHALEEAKPEDSHAPGVAVPPVSALLYAVEACPSSPQQFVEVALWMTAAAHGTPGLSPAAAAQQRARYERARAVACSGGTCA